MARCHASRATALLVLLTAFAGTVLSATATQEAVGEVVRTLTAVNRQLEVLGRTQGRGPVGGAGAHRGRALVAGVARRGLVCPKTGCSQCPFGKGVCGSILCCVREASRVSCVATNQLRSICQNSPMKLSRARCKPVRDGLAAIKRLISAVPQGLLTVCPGLPGQFKFLVNVGVQLTALQNVCCR